MQANEDPVNFVRRVFSSSSRATRSPNFVRGVQDFFAFDFVLDSDGRSLNRSDFEATLLAQRSRVVAPPRLAFSRLCASAPHDGRITVTSVHTSHLRLRSGSVCQRVIAVLEIDVASGWS